MIDLKYTVDVIYQKCQVSSPAMSSEVFDATWLPIGFPEGSWYVNSIFNTLWQFPHKLANRMTDPFHQMRVPPLIIVTDVNELIQ